LGISRCYLHRLLNQLNVSEGPEEEAELLEDEVQVEASADELPAAGSAAVARGNAVPGRPFRSSMRIT